MAERLLQHAEFICAPMVRGSELPFRMMVRKHGVKLCYSPMVKSELLVKGYAGELALLDTCPEDRPLVVQLSGRDPGTLRMACQVILEKIPDVDAVDFNLGCPQECASKGKYGAFLLEEPSVTEDCVKALCESLPSTVPVFCKIRRAETIEETIKYGRLLEHSGCKLLAIHCRLRKDKHASVPDYSFAKALVENLGIPIVANGGINSRGMARKVMEKTGCVGCMVATELLRNPKCGTLGDSTPPDPASLALEYLYFCEKYPPPSSLYIRKHLRWIFRMELEPSMHDSSRSFSEAVESEGGWRIKLWTFLVRPYLDSLWQFRKLIEYYQYMASGVDFRPKADYNPPTLRSIKAGFEYNSDGQTEPGNEETGIGNLFI